MCSVLENLVLVMSFIGLGTMLRYTKWFPENTATVLNSFVLYVALPAIIIVNLPKLEMGGAVAFPIVVHWISFAIHIGLVLVVSKLFKFSKSVTGALIIVSTLGNTAFLGIPMVKTMLGVEGIPYAVLYDQLGSGFGFILYGAFALPFYGEKESKTNIKEILFNLITFPPFVAILLGFMFMVVPMPKMAESVLNDLAATLIPCAMIAVGFQMKYKMSAKQLTPLVVGLLLKLAILPVIILVLVRMTGMKHIALDVSILQAGMPPMITAGAMAINAGIEEDLSAALVGYGLLISFLTLTGINYLM